MFVVVYWWRAHKGKEEQFRRAWREGTRAINRIYGHFGSRLHQNSDGRFVGYAEWPDEVTWRTAFNNNMSLNQEILDLFNDAVAEQPPNGEPVFTMTVTDDLLLRTNEAALLGP